MKLFKRKAGDLIISKATDEDIKFCVDTITKGMNRQSVNREILEQTLKAPNIILLVAKHDNTRLGMIYGLAFSSIFPPPRIDFLSVSDEESARKGLHGKLIDEFISELKTRLPNATFLETTVPAVNPQFVAMYSMKGFVIIGFTRGSQTRSDVVVLRKTLK